MGNDMKLSFEHKPVLYNETMDLLALQSGDFVVDGTAGGGGHLEGLAAKAGSNAEIWAFDRDERAHESDAAGRLKNSHPNIKWHHAPYSSIRSQLESADKLQSVDALLLDIGTSSHHFDDPSRGFSFQADGPLDMRMDRSAGETAYDVIRRLREDDLADLIFKYGDERLSRRIAKQIKENWPIPNSTLALAERCAKAYPKKHHKISPATRTFQALRVYVNGELEELEAILKDLPEILAPGGRCAIITFQSHEDRLVKHAFRTMEKAGEGWKRLNNRCIRGSDTEIAGNPRARSAKLRGIIKTA